MLSTLEMALKGSQGHPKTQPTGVFVIRKKKKKKRLEVSVFVMLGTTPRVAEGQKLVPPIVDSSSTLNGLEGDIE